MKAGTTPKNMDEYIKRLPADRRAIMEKIRQTVKAAAPEAEEVISYQMPAFNYHGMLVYFAAHTNHIGFYPTAGAVEAFKKDLSAYEGSKGTVKFPFDKVPYPLISKIVKFRVKKNKEKLAAKKTVTKSLKKQTS